MWAVLTIIPLAVVTLIVSPKPHLIGSAKAWLEISGKRRGSGCGAPRLSQAGLDRSGKTHQMKESVEPEEVAEKLWRLCAAKNMEDTGIFWHRDGHDLPW